MPKDPLTPEVLARAEALFGRPEVREWRHPISASEMDMVVSSTRGQTRVHDVTFVVFNPAGQVLLIRKHGYPPGVWRLPGGGVDPGEELAEGTEREALEETGLRIRVDRYLLRVDVTFTCGDREQPWTTHVVTATAPAETPVTQDPEEIQSVVWGDIADLYGPVAEAMLASGSRLFAYRVALHREIGRLLGRDDSRAAD